MKVAVGIVTDAEDRVLITQRSLATSHGGYWEFPGGKLEESETAQQALIREFNEELGIAVTVSRLLGELQHQYQGPNNNTYGYLVHLIVFHISQWQGVPQCLQGQLDLQWVKQEQLAEYRFPEANKEIIELYKNLA